MKIGGDGYRPLAIEANPRASLSGSSFSSPPKISSESAAEQSTASDDFDRFAIKEPHGYQCDSTAMFTPPSTRMRKQSQVTRHRPRIMKRYRGLRKELKRLQRQSIQDLKGKLCNALESFEECIQNLGSYSPSMPIPDRVALRPTIVPEWTFTSLPADSPSLSVAVPVLKSRLVLQTNEIMSEIFS